MPARKINSLAIVFGEAYDSGMLHARSTTRLIAVFILNAAILLLPVLSIPTCCCASSGVSAVAGTCCCSGNANSNPSRCCCSTNVCEDLATESSCDRNCQCGDLRVIQACVKLSREVKQLDWSVVTLLDWSFVPDAIDSFQEQTLNPSGRILSHNVRQSFLAVWLK